uniref:7TM GPCR domain containing protein n=1 Tax=Haemonchus contortus TaxID=6289 RepID=A0A7I4YGH6_HAECO
MFFKKVIILLIFLLALNRFAIILYATLDNLLFARYRYIALCFVCFTISAAETYIVITTSNLRREFVPNVGFIDFIDSPTSYEIGCAISLAIALVSVCLHLMIIVYLLYYRRKSSVNTAKVYVLF